MKMLLVLLLGLLVTVLSLQPVRAQQDRSAWTPADERALARTAAPEVPVHVLTQPPIVLQRGVHPAVLTEQARVESAVREFDRTRRWDRDVFSAPPAVPGSAR